MNPVQPHFILPANSRNPLQEFDILNVCLEATRIAGDIISERYGKYIETQDKGDGDLVIKEIDIASDNSIYNYLKRLYPDCHIISEELHPQGKITDNGITFIYDPMDGTVGFAMQAGKKIPSVMICAYIDGQPFSSVVHFPVTNETFYAIKGHGAYFNSEKILPQTRDLQLDKSQAWLNAYQNCPYETDFFRNISTRLRSGHGAQLTQIIPPHSGAALRMLLPGSNISLVVHDNSPTKIKQEIWDIAAPKLIMEEAGSLFLNDRLEPYNPEEPGPIVIVRNELILNQLRQLLNIN